MVIFEATYRKTDGTKRKMKFARLHDLPKSKVDKRKTVEYPAGKELVWDVQKNGYRVFDWNTVIGKVTANFA
jgi:hypothetical protein